MQAGGASGYLAITNDGGVTWTSVSPFASTVTIRFHSIRMLSATEAYVGGSDGKVYRTQNAGSTWSLEASTGVTLYSIDVYSLTQGTAGAIAGSQVYTIVSGRNFFFARIVSLTFPLNFAVVFIFSSDKSALAAAHVPTESPAQQAAYWSAFTPTHAAALVAAV